MSDKPEWFELSESDQQPEAPRFKSNKRILKIALVTAPLLLVGGAIVFAAGEGDDDDRPNIDTTISSTNNGSNQISNSASSSGSTEKTIAISNKTVAKPAQKPSKIHKGVGVPAPKANNDEEDDHQGFFGEDD